MDLYVEHLHRMMAVEALAKGLEEVVVDWGLV